MSKENYEALTSILEELRNLTNEKWGKRKRLRSNEVFRKAMIYKNLFEVESWIEEAIKTN